MDSLFTYWGIALILLAYPAFVFIQSFLVKRRRRPSPGRYSESAKENDSNGNESAPNKEQETVSSSSSSNTDAISISPTKLVNSNTNNDSIRQPKAKTSQPTRSNGWQCACEGGGIFLPQSLMKSIGGPAAALRMGRGECYHKQM